MSLHKITDIIEVTIVDKVRELLYVIPRGESRI